MLDRLVPLAQADKDAEAMALLNGEGKKAALAEQEAGRRSRGEGAAPDPFQHGATDGRPEAGG